jgi:NADH-quinone oxidoreductase subunit I
MSFLERMYLLAIVKGMIITIKHKKSFTIQYPEQTVHRGQHQLKRDEQGRELYCLYLCALSCPAEAITMTASGRTCQTKNIVQRRKICFDI